MLTDISSPEALKKESFCGISEEKQKTLLQRGYHLSEGKVREIAKKDSDILLYHSDRLTAFDCYIGLVPYKGVILTAINSFWLQHVAKEIPNYYQSTPHPRVIQGGLAVPVKAEIIVRGYLAGSMMRAYQAGERVFCGVSLPDGLKPHQKLETPIITPTSKAESFEHDEDMTAEQIVEQGICSQEEYQYISDMALNLFAIGQRVYGDKGWILVDTKYEFGRTAEGKIILIDEIHTPDSSRLWVKESYSQRFAAGQTPEMLDKENVRRYLIEQGFSGEGEVPEVPAEVLISLAKVYLEVANKLIGHELSTDVDPNDLWLPQES